MTKKSPKAVVENFAKDYNEIYYEMQTHQEEVLQYLTDADLVDTLISFVTESEYELDDVVDCYVKLSSDDKADLTPEERKKMENYYMLLFSDLGFDA